MNTAYSFDVRVRYFGQHHHQYTVAMVVVTRAAHADHVPKKMY